MGRHREQVEFGNRVGISNYSAPSEWGDDTLNETTTESQVFPIIPPQVNGATVNRRIMPLVANKAFTISNYSAPSEWGDLGRSLG